MTRSIDQDPHSNRSYDDSPTQFINRAQYPEAFTGTPLHQAAGQYFPTYADHPRFPNVIPSHVVNNPDNAAAREIVPGTDKKPSWMKRGLAALVAVGALGAGAYGIGYLKTKGEVDAINDAMGNDRTASAVEVLTEKPFLSQEAIEVKDEFDATRTQVLDEIKQDFIRDKYDLDYYGIYTNRTIQEASPNMSPQAILDRDSGKEHFLTSKPDSIALEELEFAAQPNSDAYRELAARINDPEALAASSDELTLISSKYFENGIFVDPNTGETVVAAENTPTQIIGAMGTRTRKNVVITFQYDKSLDGTTGDWRAVNIAREGETGWTDPMNVDQVTILDAN